MAPRWLVAGAAAALVAARRCRRAPPPPVPGQRPSLEGDTSAEEDVRWAAARLRSVLPRRLGGEGGREPREQRRRWRPEGVAGGPRFRLRRGLTPDEEQGDCYGAATEALWLRCRLAPVRPIFGRSDRGLCRTVGRLTGGVYSCTLMPVQELAP
jgi:hypothetical protein